MMKTRFPILQFILVAVVVLGTGIDSQGQYFGRNKARYKSFEFDVLESPHFELYHYFNDTIATDILELSERWYSIHEISFKDTIRFKNPIIFYNNHAEFQQTAAIGGHISVGTGGVTEGFKNRVVMPLMDTRSQLDHVLGHELVHAFQYNLLRNENDSLSLKNMQYVPLWMVEGLAEYLSIGRNDSHTAMWMRDAVLNDDFPSIKDLSTTSKYFPYRYGHAFWAFIGGVWGDETVLELYKNVVRYGMKVGIDSTLHIDDKALSELWRGNAKEYYTKYLPDSTEDIVGKLLAGKENSGHMNIAPSISPNGRHIVFLSEKDLFTIDLYLADIQTGEIIRKISTNTGRNSHIDALSFIESSGTWSPDGSQYAFVIFNKGKNTINIVDVWTGKTVREIEVPGIQSISHLSWSPWGNLIAFSSLNEGHSDIYLYDLEKKKVSRLTNDEFSDIQPRWSPEGNKIVFASDKISRVSGDNRIWFNISLIDLETGLRSDLDVFPGANNLNPVFSDFNEIVFLSDRYGYRNLYKYDIANKKAYQLTDYMTGISGITPYAPAVDVAARTGRIVYTYYSAGKYSIYSAESEEFQETAVALDDVNLWAEILAPGITNVGNQFVQSYMDTINRVGSIPADSLKSRPYKGKFKLDYIGNSGVGVAYGSYGLGMAGGVNMLFSDMLGNNQMFTALAVNGEVYDFGGQVAYFNQKKRLGWGASISHIPYRLDYVGYGYEELPVSEDSTILVQNLRHQVVRIFEDQLGLFSFYPFSTTRRIEWTGTYSRYYYRVDQFNNYYYQGWYIGQNREKLEAPEGYGLYRTSMAYVGDNSYFGIASPLKGHRFRFDLTQYGGELRYHGILADIRQYYFIKPFGLAFRGWFYGRYGRDIYSNRLSPIFLGNPMLIRGYNDIFFSNAYSVNPISINELYGNKALVGNVELRVPLSGPERLSAIKSKIFFTELALFVDAGTIWDTPPQFIDIESGESASAPFQNYIVSSGVSLRVNLFGQLIIEPYYAIPFQRTDLANRKGVFGLNFIPGW